MAEKLKLDRVSCHVTALCNLKCDKCSAYIPDLARMSQPQIKYTLEEMKVSFSVYFDMVEHVRMISLSGGEPLLFSELPDLVEFLSEFDNRYEKLEIFTNGTIAPSARLLAVCKTNPKVSFMVDHYGPNVSTKVDEIEKAFQENNISYKVRIYYGENSHCGGWHDYGITSGERASEETTIFRYEKCFAGINGNMLCTIFGTRLFLCPCSEVGRRIGAIPLEDTLYMELDSPTSVEEKIEELRKMNQARVNPACAYCRGIGVYENEPRYTPGKQLSE